MNWKKEEFIAIDLETTGKYPLQAEICEMAAVKWRDGKVIDTYQTLVKPSEPMSEEVIAIHSITNEMVDNAPLLKDRIFEFYEFIKSGYIVAHHAPFDLGFLAVEFEKYSLDFPEKPVFCSSIFSRKAIPQSPNHRLQTLIKYLNIDGGQAHRALDDSKACLEVLFRCFEKVGESATVEDLLKYQGIKLYWNDYSMNFFSKSDKFAPLVDAIKHRNNITFVYSGGSRPGKEREVKPLGLVRNPRGDFMVATPLNEGVAKRYYLNRVTKVL